ncbi:ROK family protein [Glutamicibacter uratoxydans]|uniref:ROK family protein n=1 Tax=Glutamicibacter uratoxydans TaxID=43667 RepID=A0A4Y4DP27_GLUUR|nr:ROK family transcriptional regulator [Glutamicibacter uratoxydans]GED06676.1 ROK family protein [Glutamicibacter uratoxydans]
MTSTSGTRRSMTRRTASLPSHGREHNLALVLQHLYAQGPMSRADLSRASGLTRVTISDLVTELMSRGHVIELGTSNASRPGKPSILVDINRKGLQIIGVDLADSAVMRAAVMDLDGNVLTRVELETNDEKGEAATAQVIDLTGQAIAAATERIIGIGVGTPGIVNNDGLILTAPNFGWTNVDLHREIHERFSLPTHVLNDADGAVMGEHTFGNGSAHMMLVKLGRGVGCGTLVNGVRVRGANAASGELGHVIVGTDQGPLCICGKHGCLESWVSIPSIRRALAQRPEGISPEEHRAKIMQQAAERLGIVLAPIVSVLDIQDLVIAGPARFVDDQLLAALQETITARTNASQRPNFTVQLSENPDDIVLRGAAVNVLFNELGVA